MDVNEEDGNVGDGVHDGVFCMADSNAGVLHAQTMVYIKHHYTYYTYTSVQTTLTTKTTPVVLPAPP